MSDLESHRVSSLLFHELCQINLLNHHSLDERNEAPTRETGEKQMVGGKHGQVGGEVHMEDGHLGVYGT